MSETLKVYAVGFKNKTVAIVREQTRQLASARGAKAAGQRLSDVVFKVRVRDLDPYKIGRNDTRVVKPELSSGEGFHVMDVDRILCAWLLKRGFWDSSTPFFEAVTKMVPSSVPTPKEKSLQELIEYPPFTRPNFKGYDEDHTQVDHNPTRVSLVLKIRRFFRDVLDKVISLWYH